MKDFITTRLSRILKYPDAWGPPLAVETQVILLVEMWCILQGKIEKEIYETSDRLYLFAYESTKIPGPLTLADNLKLESHANEEFVAILKAFIISEGINV